MTSPYCWNHSDGCRYQRLPPITLNECIKPVSATAYEGVHRWRTTLVDQVNATPPITSNHANKLSTAPVIKTVDKVWTTRLIGVAKGDATDAQTISGPRAGY